LALVMTPQGATSSYQALWTMYVNGSAVATLTAAQGAQYPMPIYRNDAYIGGSDWTDAPVAGLFDEFRVYNYPLTATQVSGLAAVYGFGFSSSTSSPVVPTGATSSVSPTVAPTSAAAATSQPPSSTASPPPTSSSSSSLTGGAIAGIVIGCVVGVALILLLCIAIFLSGRRSKKGEDMTASSGKDQYGNRAGGGYDTMEASTAEPSNVVNPADVEMTDMETHGGHHE